MLTNGLVTYLLAQPSITRILGSSTTAIRPIPAPEDLGGYPCITYQSASYVAEYAGHGPVGVSKTRIVFDCLALRYLDARNLAQALKAALDNLCEAISAASPAATLLPDGTRIFNAEIANIVDRWDDGSRIYCVSVHLLAQSNE
jgi:hypothetical protein